MGSYPMEVSAACTSRAAAICRGPARGRLRAAGPRRYGDDESNQWGCCPGLLEILPGRLPGGPYVRSGQGNTGACEHHLSQQAGSSSSSSVVDMRGMHQRCLWPGMPAGYWWSVPGVSEGWTCVCVAAWCCSRLQLHVPSTLQGALSHAGECIGAAAASTSCGRR
jgi:hypothetical protein